MRICAIGLRGIPGVLGGIETHCEQLYPKLAKLDADLDLIVIGRTGHAHPQTYAGIKVITLWAPKQKFLETLVHTPLAILFVRLFLHPDIVHLHGVGPGFFTLFARMLGMRVVATHHAADYERPKWHVFGKTFLRTGEGVVARFANHIVCVSQALTDMMTRKYPGTRAKITMIHNGAPALAPPVNAEEVLSALGLAKGNFVLAVGRLDPTKGFHDLVSAFKRARPSGMKLVIAGAATADDDYSRALLAERSPGVIFAGMLPSSKLRVLYENTALFAHPSSMEGFALVILEALAANAPVLLSDIPANREFGLADKHYFPVGDTKALRDALAQPNYGAFACADAARIVEENSWDSAAEKHLDIYTSVSRGRSPARKSTSNSAPHARR